MKDYFIRVPFVGSVVVEVRAENEKEALSKAIEAADNQYEFRNTSTDSPINEYDYEFMKRLTSGNCNHFSCNEIDIESEEDIE